MTIRLFPAARRGVERLAARDGTSLDEDLDRLLEQAPEQANTPTRRRWHRLKACENGSGFEVVQARQLAARMSDAD